MPRNAVRFELKLEGMDQFERYLTKVIPNGISAAATEALRETAVEARDIAKSLVVVDTGSLQRSIRLERLARQRGKIYYTGIRAGGYIINPKTGRYVDYARWIEYGSSRMYARPFMRPALRRAMRKLSSRYWRALEGRIATR